MAGDREHVGDPGAVEGPVEGFGPYRLERLLGRGGMGEVFRAYDTEHQRLVAVKRLAAHLVDDREFRERFRREARLAAQLRNPHIIPIHRYGELDGHLYIDMRYVEGFDVGDLVHAVGAVDPARAVSLVGQAASALATAHAAGLVHRDVKPSNLLVDRESDVADGFVYLADFGVSRSTTTTRSQTLTRTGAVLGSLDYMAPEQFDGVVDPLIDVYSLTCVLFELLTGYKPYRGDNLPMLMHAHLNIPPPAPTDLRPELPEEFDEVVRRGMAKRREERFGSAQELARAARSALRALTPGAGAADSAPTEDTNARRHELALVLRHREQSQRELPSGRHVLREVEVDDVGPRASADPSAASTIEPPPEAVAESGAGPVDEPATEPVHQVDHRSDETADIDGLTERVVRPGAPGRGGASPPPRSRVRVVLAAASALVVVLATFVAVALSRSSAEEPAGGGPAAAPVTADPSAPPPPPTSAPPVVPLAAIGTPTVDSEVRLEGSPQGAALSPDGRTLYVAESTTGHLAIVDVASGSVRGRVDLQGPPRYVAVSVDGQRVFVAMWADDSSGSRVAAVDVASQTVAKVVDTGPKPYALATAPDGRVWVPIHHDGSGISVLDPDTLEVVAQVAVPANPHAVAFSPDGARAYSANHESNSVSVIDTRTDVVVADIPLDVERAMAPHSVAASPDGRWIATANYVADSVSIVSTETNTVVGTHPAGDGPQTLTWSADGRYVYAVDELGGVVTTLEADGGRIVGTTAVGRSPRFILRTQDGARLYVTGFHSRGVAVLRAA